MNNLNVRGATISLVTEELIQFLKENEGKAFHEAVQLMRGALIEEALIQCRGNQTKAAEMLGINRNTLTKHTPKREVSHV